MTAGWGVEPTKTDGVVTSGTLSSDVRKVWGALYNPGIITGGVVTTSGTNMTYEITQGVAAIETSTGEIILTPFDGKAITAPAAPSSGTRTDRIYVKQYTPASGGNSYSDVLLDSTNATLTNSLVIGTYTVSAGDTSTNQAVVSADVDYSIPYGVSGAVLHYWRDTSNGALITAGSSGGTGSFYLPTDRKILLSLTSCLSSNGSTAGWDNASFTVARYAPYIDDIRQVTWLTPGLTSTKSTYQFEAYVNLSAGTHVAYLGFDREAGPGYPVRHYSGADKWPGTYFAIRDAGVID